MVVVQINTVGMISHTQSHNLATPFQVQLTRDGVDIRKAQQAKHDARAAHGEKTRVPLAAPLVH